MQGVARGIFASAISGTLALPVALGVVAWRMQPGKRARRMLALAGGWIAVCVLAAVVRLATDDAYYQPQHVTYWSQTSSGERRVIVGLLVAAAVAATSALALSRSTRPSRSAAVAVIAVAWLVDVVMLADAVLLGLH